MKFFGGKITFHLTGVPMEKPFLAHRLNNHRQWAGFAYRSRLAGSGSSTWYFSFSPLDISSSRMTF